MEGNKDFAQYADMLHLPRYVSKRHTQMPRCDRAAQFAPFAALTGHQEVIRQTELEHVSEDMEREIFYEDGEELDQSGTKRV